MTDNSFSNYILLFIFHKFNFTRTRKNYSFFKSKFSYYLSDKIVKIVRKLYVFSIFVLIFFTIENDIY